MLGSVWVDLEDRLLRRTPVGVVEQLPLRQPSPHGAQRGRLHLGGALAGLVEAQIDLMTEKEARSKRPLPMKRPLSEDYELRSVSDSVRILHFPSSVDLRPNRLGVVLAGHRFSCILVVLFCFASRRLVLWQTRNVVRPEAQGDVSFLPWFRSRDHPLIHSFNYPQILSFVDSFIYSFFVVLLLPLRGVSLLHTVSS